MYTFILCAFVVQLKHYHASSKVVRRAEEVYGKLKGLYMYPKLVPRPLKKKAVGGAGIRKRPPTMAEYLNTQVLRVVLTSSYMYLYNMCLRYCVHIHLYLNLVLSLNVKGLNWCT